MATFMTRVELHDATYMDYESLHSAMQREGFTRTILAADGNTYILPTAEYYRTAQLTKNQVLESAQRAAVMTRKRYAVIVAETSGVTWSGLPIVNS
ncbi:MAG TPA: hypothetical protein VLX68_01140 [Chitinivibrionales bacterium]|nr:hypothetical protein [Chitinivibrionales bacterium]